MIDKSIFMLCKSMTEQEADKTAQTNNPYLTANIKFDGERVLCIKKDDSVILMNRGSNIINKNFREVVEELKTIQGDFIIDGEIITTDDNFTKLMQRARLSNTEKIKQREKEIPVKFMVFDILMKGNEQIMNKTLKHRLQELKSLFNDDNQSNNQSDNQSNNQSDNQSNHSHILLAEYNDVGIMLNKAREEKREGIIIKNITGLYESGKRSDEWLKVKFFKEEEFKAIKYEVNNKGIKVIDEKDRSVQISGEQHEEVKHLIDTNGEALIEIQYLTKSKDGNYRFPSYKRIVNNI